MADIIFKLLLAYLAGSVSGSLFLGKFKHVDIRGLGSGNAGGTNALRTQGKVFALGVIIIDIGKGAVAAGLIPTLTLLSATAPPVWLAYACGALAVIGHCYPIYFGFRGGKGAATLVGTLLVFAPVLVAPLLGVWLVTIMLTGFVGLATMLTAVAAWVLVAVFMLPGAQPLFVYALLMSVLIIFTHRSNITRMRSGNESRNDRLMLLRRK